MLAKWANSKILPYIRIAERYAFGNLKWRAKDYINFKWNPGSVVNFTTFPSNKNIVKYYSLQKCTSTTGFVYMLLISDTGIKHLKDRLNAKLKSIHHKKLCNGYIYICIQLSCLDFLREIDIVFR